MKILLLPRSKRQYYGGKSFNIYRFSHKYNYFLHTKGINFAEELQKGSKIAVCLMLYRAPLLKKLRFLNVHLGEDISFGNIINALNPKIAYTRMARYFIAKEKTQW